MLYRSILALLLLATSYLPAQATDVMVLMNRLDHQNQSATHQGADFLMSRDADGRLQFQPVIQLQPEPWYGNRSGSRTIILNPGNTSRVQRFGNGYRVTDETGTTIIRPSGRGQVISGPQGTTHIRPFGNGYRVTDPSGSTIYRDPNTPLGRLQANRRRFD